MTTGAGVKPTFQTVFPFDGQRTFTMALLQLPRSACAAAAHTLAPPPPSTDLSSLSVGPLVCVTRF
jgi:hypothetical protein